MRKTMWEFGDQKRMAELAGCHYTHLNDIIHGRKQCRPSLAMRLERAARTLGYTIPRAVWAFEDLRRGNPLFKKFV